MDVDAIISTIISALNAVFRFIVLLPDAVIMGVIALALIAILLINAGHTKRTIARLEYESRHRDMDREISLRREVYFAVADYMAGLQSFILDLPDANPSRGALLGRVNGLESLYLKIHMVGSNDTIEKLNELMVSFAEIMSSLMPFKSKMTFWERELAALDADIEALTSEKSDLLIVLRSLDQTGRLGAAKLDALVIHFDELKTRSHDMRARRANLSREIYHAREELALECANAAIRLSELMIPANRSIRDELKVPFDSERYETTMRQSQKRTREAYRKYFAGATKLFNDQFKSGL